MLISAKNKAYNMLLTAQVLHLGNTAKEEALKQARAVRAIAPVHLWKYWDEVVMELSKINI
jgi:hypothetical protein